MRRIPALFAALAIGLLLACGGAAPGAHPGEQVAFTSCRLENPEDPEDSYPICNILVVNADGSGLTRLTDLPAFNPENDTPYAVWSPDGTRIAFAFPDVGSEDEGGFDSDIYLMNADGSGQKNLTNSPGVNDVRPFWSPEGQRVAFDSEREGTYEAYVINVDGTSLTPGGYLAPWSSAWSRDSSRFVFVLEREGNAEIYSANIDGAGVTNLTNSPSRDGSPAWSPDGSRIAFVSDRDGNPQIYVMKADGSGPERLTTSGGEDPAWSADGSRIAFHIGSELHVINADGSGLAPIADNLYGDYHFSWSPDGNRIAFECNFSEPSGENNEVCLVNADGSDLTNLTQSPAYDVRPAWSPVHK
jgi:Tol biopolymer transport system component